MRRTALLAGGLLGGLLLVFAAVEAAGVPLLTDPRPAMREAGALVGVALLVADVLVPVPSSVVMVAHGSLYGVAAGSLLSLAGGTGAAVTGWALGRRADPLRRWTPDAERRRAERLLARWGLAAVVLTRPVPLLAEAVAVAAGAAHLPVRRVAVAAALGTLPVAVAYAVAGARLAGG
jgi:uncharacterized membrane protein YdjX (TVP38/TMEM64 family)